MQDNTFDTLAKASVATAEGSVYNRVLIASLFAVGLLHVRRTAAATRKSGVAVSFMILGAYTSWSLLSVMWSDDPGLSIRRLSAYVMIVCGCACLGGGYYGRNRDQLQILRRHVFVAGATAALALGFAAVKSGSLSDMLAPDWSLKGDLSIAPFGFTAAYAMVALAAYPGRFGHNVPTLAGFFFVLFALKGRTNLLAVTASLLVCRAYLANRTKRFVLLLLATVVAAIILDFMTGAKTIQLATRIVENSSEQVLTYLTIGQGKDDLSSMSGRAPLWKLLYAEVPRQPLLGHGFGAFWTAARCEQMYRLVGWRAVTAHSGYLDEVLATGLVGLLMVASFWSHAFARLRVAVRHGNWYGAMVLAWIVLLLLSNMTASIFQVDLFQFPFLATLIGVFAVLAAPRPQRSSSAKLV